MAALLERACSEDVRSWEVPLLAFACPSTVCFSTRREASGELHFFGSVLPESLGSTMRQLNETMSDVVSLNREISRQKKQLSAKNQEHGRLSRSGGVQQGHARPARGICPRWKRARASCGRRSFEPRTWSRRYGACCGRSSPPAVRCESAV
jgi:hypothetical protein